MTLVDPHAGRWRPSGENGDPGLRFGILGPLQVLENGHSLDTGSRKQQIVLALLLCHANSLVSFGSLAKAVWGDCAPRTARKNIQVYVSALRGLFGGSDGSRISYWNGGYIFRADPAELDSLCFEQMARQASRVQHAQPSAAADVLVGALDLWRGRALDGMREVALLSAAAQRLDQRFLAVFEDWAEAEIAAGSGPDVIDRVTEVVQEHPLRERLRILQMTALCQAGRRSEALAVYDDLRQLLARDLGLFPGPAVTQFYQSLLHDGDLATPRSVSRPARRRTPRGLLPRDLQSFTGRAQATRDLTDALTCDGNGLAVVTGPLGVGKTALAVHVAHRLGDDYPDGRFLVRLRCDDGALRPVPAVESDLLWAVSPDGGPDPILDRGRAWQRWLAGHRALVILDDARRELDVGPLLPETGESAVIVTARSWLAGLDAAHRLRVPAFAVAEAVEFLGRIIGPGKVAADRNSAERIVTAAGLLPLAVRVVAGRLSLLHHVTLRDFAARITAPADLLDELTVGDAAIRPRLAQAIAELPEAARLAVLRLGMLSGSVFTLREAAAILGTDCSSGERVLERLLEASIVTIPGADEHAPTVRYEFPVLTYAYARELATAEPDHGARALPISECLHTSDP
jgi:DNA-binding SARP family transcriptional activator